MRAVPLSPFVSETPGSLDPKAPGGQCQLRGSFLLDTLTVSRKRHQCPRRAPSWGCAPSTIGFMLSAGLRAFECAEQTLCEQEVEEEQQEDLGGGGEGSLFCSLLSRAAGEFQKASRGSLVNTTGQAAAKAGPKPRQPGRMARQCCRGAILHLSPIPQGWKLQKRPSQGFCLALPTWMPPPQCYPEAGYSLLWNTSLIFQPHTDPAVQPVPSHLVCLSTTH